jgi:hypothetical protein
LNDRQRAKAAEFMKMDFLVKERETWRLTAAGRLFLNKILLELM